MTKLGSHIFTPEDIEWFASAAGDFNPMHVDRIFARRLITGGQTVHGMYTLLFALDLYYQTHSHIPNQIKVFFQKPVLEGESIEFFYETDLTETILIARNNFGQVASILLSGEGNTITNSIHSNRPARKSVREYSFSEIKGKRGILSVMAAQEDLDQKFPNASRMLGAHIVATMMAFSRLVGMSMPGLHSIFTGLDLKFGLQGTAPLSWKVTRHVSPNVPIKITLEGQGIFAEINSFVRPAPVKQATMQEVRGVIAPDVFSGQRALIIGGSRGLGELAAKCLAAGGGEVCITYMNGKSDADKIEKAINDTGGVCKKSMLNVNNLDGVDGLIKSFEPTHIYYFASPTIRNNIQIYNTDLFNEYFSIYVTAFCKLVRMISENVHYPFHVFFPSTVFIDNEKKGFAEYINAKREGEHQAKLLDLKNSKINIFIKRLPVLKTDQTASLTAGEAKSALDEIRNVLTEMR